MEIMPRTVDGEVVTCMVCGEGTHIILRVGEFSEDEEFIYTEVELICAECKGTFMHWKGMDNIQFSEKLKVAKEKFSEKSEEK